MLHFYFVHVNMSILLKAALCRLSLVYSILFHLCLSLSSILIYSIYVSFNVALYILFYCLILCYVKLFELS